MEGVLSAVLRYGAVVASFWLALGMVLGAYNKAVSPVDTLAAASGGCLSIGVVLLIALPVLRVAIMMLVFLLQKDYSFTVISAAVLVIIILGFALGVLNPHIDLR
jgi:uncharacterized membrane protein